MLKFNLDNGEQVQMDREPLEMKLLEEIFTKFDVARENDPGLYTVLKQAINLVLTFGKMKVDIPRGENSLEFLVAHYVGLGMDLLEQEPLSVHGRVQVLDVKADEPPSRD